MFNFLASEYSAQAARNPLGFFAFALVFLVGSFLGLVHWDRVFEKPVEVNPAAQWEHEISQEEANKYCAEKRLARNVTVVSGPNWTRSWFHCDGSYLKPNERGFVTLYNVELPPRPRRW